MRLRIGIVGRDKVRLIIAGVGVTSGVLSVGIYTPVIIMVATKTIITLIWLKGAYNFEKNLIKI